MKIHATCSTIHPTPFVCFGIGGQKNVNWDTATALKQEKLSKIEI